MILKQINREQQDIETIVESFDGLRCSLEQNSSLLESQANLKSVIRKVLITNKEIPTHLATVIAKTILYSNMIEELVERKKRYKKHSHLRRVYDHITDKAAEKLQPATTEEIDNVTLDIVNLAKDVVASLKGKAEIKDDIQQTFDTLLHRLMTTATERNRVSIMKLASRIVQSNQDVKKRREIIAQHLD